MSNYSQEEFEASQNGGDGPANDQLFKLKLSVDIRGAKNFKVAANVFVKFTLQLNKQFP